MAAPAPTTRVTPVGKRLENGFVSKLTLASDTNISFWEISVQPPGMDGGELIDISDQWNVRYRSKVPQGLIEMTDCVVVAHYDPDLKNQIDDVINVPTTATVLYPDGSTEAFYCVPRSIEYDPLENGTDPRCTITLGTTNYDHTNDVEAGPTVTSVAGT